MKRLLLSATATLIALGSVAQSNIHEEQFNIGNGLLLSGTNFAPFVTIEETGCGEVKITDADLNDATPGPYKPMVFTPRNSCGSSITPIDMSSSPTINMRVRGEAGLIVGAQLVDNGSPSAKTARVQLTLTGGWEFEELNFVFDTTTADAGFDPSSIKQIFITLDPVSTNTGGWTGDSLYIDYIALGPATGSENATCKSGVEAFGDGTTTFFAQQFDNTASVGLGGAASDSLIMDQASDCGWLTIMDDPAKGLLPEFKPLTYTIKDDQGVSTNADITGNEKVIVKAKPFGGDVEMRIDLKAFTADNSTNGCEGRLTKTFPADKWSIVEYDFQSVNLKDDQGGTVDITEIKGANIFFLGGDGLGADSIIFDYITVGEAPSTVDPLCISGVSKIEKNTLEIFPNPTSGNVWINAIEEGSVTINNMMGQRVIAEELSAGSMELNLDDLDRGTYIMSFIGRSGAIQTQTILKD